MTQSLAKKPPGRPKGEQSENAARRRHQLIEAAIDSIVEHGMSATTLATVSKAAGLSQGVAIFYFKSKENLLVETLRHHYEDYQELWSKAVREAGNDPIERLMALVFAELDPHICNSRTLALWNSYWGEAAARPRFAELCEAYDGGRSKVLIEICESAAPLIENQIWTPQAVADVLDTVTDGLWTRRHISPGYMSLTEAREHLARLMASIFPSRAAQIMDRALALNG